MIPVDKDVPVPPSSETRYESKYPWNFMKPGDSFLIPVKRDIVLTNRYAKQLIYKRVGGHPSEKYVRAAVDGGVRIWRTE